MRESDKNLVTSWATPEKPVNVSKAVGRDRRTPFQGQNAGSNPARDASLSHP